MAHASTSAASGSCRHLTAGVTVASAGILALSLVAVPPDIDVARNEIRAVRLAAHALPSAAFLGAVEKFIGDQAQTVVPITQAVAGAADIPAAFVKASTADVTTSFTSDSAIDAARNTQKAETAALEPSAALLVEPILPALDPFLALLNPGVLLLFGPLIVLVVLACPPCALFNFLTFTLPSLFIPFAPLSAVAAPLEAPAELTSDPLPSEPFTATEAPADVARAAETNEADVAPSEESIDKRTRTEHGTWKEAATEIDQTPKESVAPTAGETETVEAEEVSAEPVAVNAPEPEAGAPTSEPTTPAGRPSPRPVVRDSLKAGEQEASVLRPGNGGRSTSRPGVDDEKVTAESSSPASSPADPPSGGGASGGDSSDGDADGS
jgi:hypothetical protein